MKPIAVICSLFLVSLASGAQQSTPSSSAPQQQSQPAPPAQAPPPQSANPSQSGAAVATQRVMELPVSNASQSTGADPNALHLIPTPKQISRGEGAFAVGATTRIVLNAKHAKEDRLAAEEIADEISAATGRKLRVTTAAAMPPGAGVIYLARSGDDPTMSARLKALNLAMAADFSDQGYVLAADKTRVVISARFGEGLFYAAQTLRQLILPGG